LSIAVEMIVQQCDELLISDVVVVIFTDEEAKALSRVQLIVDCAVFIQYIIYDDTVTLDEKFTVFENVLSSLFCHVVLYVQYSLGVAVSASCTSLADLLLVV